MQMFHFISVKVVYVHYKGGLRLDIRRPGRRGFSNFDVTEEGGVKLVKKPGHHMFVISQENIPIGEESSA